MGRPDAVRRQVRTLEETPDPSIIGQNQPSPIQPILGPRQRCTSGYRDGPPTRRPPRHPRLVGTPQSTGPLAPRNRALWQAIFGPATLPDPSRRTSPL